MNGKDGTGARVALRKLGAGGSPGSVGRETCRRGAALGGGGQAVEGRIAPRGGDGKRLVS